MGSEVMDLSVFKNGGVFYSATIQAGAAQVTADIADAFDTSFEEAERLSTKSAQPLILTPPPTRTKLFIERYKFLSCLLIFFLINNNKD
jgi:cell division ATPase FtsA